MANIPSKRILKLWNGRGHGKYQKKHINVAAYSKKQAAEIVGIACEARVSTTEITEYYGDCWGNDMQNITPTEPCVYIKEKFSKSEPVRVY